MSFDDEVLHIDDTGGFFVTNADPDVEVSSDDAVLDEDDREEVIVEFPGGTDLHEMTLIGAEDGTVPSVDGKSNPHTTTGLGNLPEGGTVGPELEASSTQTGVNWITYEFDTELERDGVSASDFGFHSAVAHTGDDVAQLVDDHVTVQFDKHDGAHVGDAVRVFVTDGAVQDRAGHDNIVGVLGGNTAAPDLARADQLSDTAVQFEFDDAVSDIDPTGS